MKLAASANTVLFRYNQKAVIPRVAERYLRAPLHPIRPKIAHMYEHRDPNTLWWNVTVLQLAQFKKVVRSWSARRARIAFELALKQQGFDKLGIPLGPSKDMQEERFTGTLDIIVRPSCVKESFETIQQDTHRLLESILSQRKMHMERAANGSKEPSKSSQSSESS